MNENKWKSRTLVFLQWFCPPDLVEGVEGDLLEDYEVNLNCYGERLATWRLMIGVLKFFRPEIVFRNKMINPIMNLALVSSYFKISWRHFVKNKMFAVINIMGLAAGMAVALLAYDYVSFEWSYDGFHKNANHIYRVTTQWNKGTTANDNRATTVAWSGPAVKQEFAEVLDYARFADIKNFTGYSAVTYKDIKIDGQNIFLADPAFLKIFSFKLLKGDLNTALNDPSGIVITNSIAEKYFEGENPVGKDLFIDTHGNLGKNNFQVTGVIEDPPSNSHLDFDFLLSFNVIWKGLHDGSTYWHWDYTYAYLLLRPDADITMLEEKMSALRVRQHGKDMQYYSDAIHFKLQPLRDIHLNSSLKGELMINGDGRFVYFLMIIGVCALLSAYINYVNLSAIKAMERKTEIGVRKVIGSTKTQLTMQLLTESVSLNILALIISILIYVLSIPFIERLFNIHWPSDTFHFVTPQFLLVVIAVIFFGVVISALYPAFIVSAYKPAEVLKAKGATAEVGTGWSLRKSLVVVQFVFSIVFTISAYVLHEQTKHMRDHDLGMNIEQVIALKSYGFEDYERDEVLREKLSALPFVSSVALSSSAPGDEIIELALKPKIATAEAPSIQNEVKMVMVDEHYFETMGVVFTAGRSFDHSIKSDDKAIILNEAAAKLLGYKDSKTALNTYVKNLSEHDARVIGVTKNYHQRSLKTNYEPMVFLPLWRNDFGWNKKYVFIRLNVVESKTTYQEAVSGVERTWAEIKPDKPFQYFFVNEYFDRQYKADIAFTALFLFFTSLAIFIACLGLFGLVAYTTIQRTKEIGIRKVLGATVSNILSLLTWDFMKLILIATSVALPLVIWGVSVWLTQYAFRIPMNAWLFIAPLILIFALAIITVGLRSLKVATANPVKSLRYE